MSKSSLYKDKIPVYFCVHSFFPTRPSSNHVINKNPNLWTPALHRHTGAQLYVLFLQIVSRPHWKKNNPGEDTKVKIGSCRSSDVHPSGVFSDTQAPLDINTELFFTGADA